MFRVHAQTGGGEDSSAFGESDNTTVTTQTQNPIEGCDPSSAGLDLGNCYTVGIDQTTTVKSLFDTPADLVNLLVTNLFALSGLILLFFFIYAGFQYISDTSKGKDTAREILSTALKGFILMFCAYWIVQLAVFMTGVDSPL